MSEPRAREGTPGYGGPEAEWSPVPLGDIKRWLAENPDAKMESVFPTVYEEDRTAKIKDLATAQALGYITHRRAAEQTVKELGFENYDYEAEQGLIQAEAKRVPPTELGVADGIARAIVGLPRPDAPAPGGDPTLVPSFATPPNVPTGDGYLNGPEPHGKRQDLSAPEQAEFRKSQKEDTA